MTTKIVIIGDTHAKDLQDLPKMMLESITITDWVIHVGDYISENIIMSLKQLKKGCFKGVYGNADTLGVRKIVPERDIFEINGKKIGIIHPSSGGDYASTLKRVLSSFRNDKVDVIAYGHTHDPTILFYEKILLINPGKGYLEQNYFGPPTSFAVLYLEETLRAEIVIVDR